MKTIESFQKARPLLTRAAPFTSPSPPSSKGKARTGALSVEQTVSNIISEVREGGDRALFNFARKLDKVELAALEVTQSEISAAYDKVDRKLVSALRLASRRIGQFHRLCRRRFDSSFLKNGLGRRVAPLERVGIYVPGGKAAYPSTVLMTAVPARVAGVKEIILATPPHRDGTVPAPTLVAADIAGVDRLFKIGGAQAIAALAFGTESIPRVDKICGPGNIFVITAKRLVYGTVDIESLPGPSEIMVVADESADASYCAADLIAQAEHDPLASVILITTSAALSRRVEREIRLQLAKLERKAIASEAIDARGMIVLVESPDEATELVNLYAPEHVSLMVHNAGTYVEKIRNAGCIFAGSSSPVAMGDYIAGPSHVLPTGGSARFSSPLGVEDFLKVTNVIAMDITQLTKLGRAAVTIARAEGLQGHAQAIELRLRDAENEAG